MRLKLLLVLQTLIFTVTPVESLFHRRVFHEIPNSEATISTSYDAFREIPIGLQHVNSADTNVFASILVAPALPNASPDLVQVDGRKLTTRESPSTHVAYNCTSTSSMWNLEQDSSVLELQDFSIMNDEFVIGATFLVADCDELLRSSVDRVVVGNSFFGVEFTGQTSYFYVVNGAVLDDFENKNGRLGRCRVRLEMEPATFAQVFPDCRIKFHSTDINNLIRTESIEAATMMQARRKLETSTFGFVKDSSCQYDCGEEGDAGEIDIDKCWANTDKTWTETQCTLQFYAQNSKCSSECGYDTLSPNQCYDCTSSDGSCESGYNSTDDGCCRVLDCEAVDDTAITGPGTLSWNLDDDGLTASNSSYPIFEMGNCSDTSDPSTDCCRITCENCFLNVSVASIFADVEVVGVSFDEAIEMELIGNANLEVALYAPNGCTLDETKQLKNASFNIPLGDTGISVEIAMGLDLHRKISLHPHASTTIIGASAELQSLRAGSLRSETFHEVKITTNTSSKLSQSSIDVKMELELAPSFQASLSLLKNVAKVGVKAEFLVFLELNSTFQYSDPFPGLSSKYFDDSSLWHGGNCQLPHYMEYNCNAGYGEVNISIPLSVKIPYIGNKSTELDIVSSSSRSSFSLFSGCVATAYDAEILLSTAMDAVSSLSDEAIHALQTILVWTLGMTDIDSDFVNISSFSTETGEISITLSVPPSLGELYPNASDFVAEVYQRARNETFAITVSNYVGLEIGAQCDDNWWGARCNQACSAPNCTSRSISCNAVDGVILSCGSCKDGYWGATCESLCKIPDGCTNARCNQTNGAEEKCVTCDDGDSLCSDNSSGSPPLLRIANAVVLGLVGFCMFVLA